MDLPRTPNPASPSLRVLLGVALVCFANLLLEIVLTRIFSATMYYHFAFLAIALALFGLGASGVYVYVRSERFPIERARADLARYSLLFALATVLMVVYVLANPVDVLGTSSGVLSKQVILQLLLFHGVTAVPFFFAGMVVSLAITHYSHQVDRVYFFDLCGAALAALTVGPLLWTLGAPTLALSVSLIGAIAAALFVTPRGIGWLPAAASLCLVLLNLTLAPVAVPTVKGVAVERTVFEGWNVFSRVTVDDKNWIRIDAGAATKIATTDAIERARRHPSLKSIGYAIFESGPGKVLILGPGGGRDVVRALAADAQNIVGVEVNPLIAETIMKERFRRESGDLYFHPRVRIVTDEGRSFIRRSPERYDVIQATLVDTWAATAAGAFALAENALYTLEAFDDYYEHLTDQGILTMTRWYQGARGETARLLLLAAGALERRGVPTRETRNHLFLAVKPRGSLFTLIAKRTPFSPEDLQRLERVCNEQGFQILVSPHSSTPSPLEQLVDAGAFSQAVEALPENLSPPTDDRPFFFYFEKSLWDLSAHLERNVSSPALWILVSFIAVGILTLSFILLPLAILRGKALRGDESNGGLRRGIVLGYFAAIGIAFITVEIALLQKFTLFLGHPSYALIVVLFTILIATAVGARLSGRIPEPSRLRAIAISGVVLAGLCVLYASSLGPLLSAWIAWPFVARVGVSALLASVCGLLMGIMLPTGIQVVSRRDPAIVPWGWGMNGAASVVGTVAATAIGIHGGFNAALLVGAGGYLIAALLGGLLDRAPSAGAGLQTS